ncbi:MAG: hypothetical protein RL338_1303, partial [Chloroflexota bacterium]
FSTGSLTLAVGSHEICGVARDASGNTSATVCATVTVIDTTAPSIRVVSAPLGTVEFGADFDVVFSASDGTTGGGSVTTGEFRIDGGPWVTGAATDGSFGEVEEDFSTGSLALPVGSHVICGRATDASGNTSPTFACATVVVVDSTSPSIRVVSAPAAPVAFGTPVSVVFSASDGTTGGSSISTGDYRIDGGGFTAGAATDGSFDEVEEDFSTGSLALAVGSHEICGRATDASGNTQATPACVTVVVTDGSGPTVRVVSAPSGPVDYGTPVSVVFSASDGTTGGGSVTTGEFRIDGGPWGIGAATDGSFGEVEEDFSTGSLTLPVGSHEICGRATDASGNTSLTSGDSCTTVTVVDGSAPTVRVVSAPTSVPYGTPVIVVFSASDGTTGGSSITSGDYRIGDGAWFPGSATDGSFGEVEEDFSTGSLTLASGTHVICGRARDAAGRESATTGESCVTVTVEDATGPTVTVVGVSPGAIVTFGDEVRVTFRASDVTSGASSITSGEYRIDGGTWQSASATDGSFDEVEEDFSTGTLVMGAGTHTICGRARDATGSLSDETPASCTTVQVLAATTTVTYLGPAYDDDVDGGVDLTAGISGPYACLVAGNLTFQVRDITSGAEVTAATVPTAGSTEGTARISLTDGIYTIHVSFTTGDGNCVGDTDEAILAVVMPGQDAAHGGGWYRYSGAGAPPGNSRINFAFQVRLVKAGRNATSYRGQLLWMNTGHHRLRVDLSTTDGSAYGRLRCPAIPGYKLASCATLSGRGVLEDWTASGWERRPGTFPILATVYDGGEVIECKGQGRTKTCTKKERPDFFGIEFTTLPAGAIRESLPQELRGGSIAVF